MFLSKIGPIQLDLKMDLLKNETKGSLYRLEEALDSLGDC